MNIRNQTLKASRKQISGPIKLTQFVYRYSSSGLVTHNNNSRYKVSYKGPFIFYEVVGACGIF